jgi:hypothetical protein
MGIASPPAAARNVTVENFLPQQGWGRVEEFKFPEGKIHYPLSPLQRFTTERTEHEERGRFMNKRIIFCHQAHVRKIFTTLLFNER